MRDSRKLVGMWISQYMKMSFDGSKLAENLSRLQANIFTGPEFFVFFKQVIITREI